MSDWTATCYHLLDRALGLQVNPAELTFFQMTARAFVVFTWGVLIVRFGDRRLLGKNAGFDVLLVVILGSVLSRAVNGQSAFFPTLGVSAVLILLHHLLAKAATRWDWFSRVVKGKARLLIREGRADLAELRRTNITKDDLDENLRLEANLSDASQVREARLERNGVISVVRKP
jgi:uncharacterized membrane protein YcaP (DUF421 family)